MATKAEWDRFCDRASSVMRDARQNQITLEEASHFFDGTLRSRIAISRRFLESLVWEIDGFPGMYDEVIWLFEARASEDDLVKYLSS